jgi:phospholipid/cholesterol/gamma-HCH transport system substrate-binding protein
MTSPRRRLVERRRRLVENLLGAALAFVLLLSVVLIWNSFSGKFSNKIKVSAQLAQAGDALEIGDIVTYHDVIVGEVSSATGRLAGGAVATLRIDPAMAKVIPASVTAVAVPASLFGLTKVELIAPSDLSGPRLAAGDVIREDTSPAAESLQTALADAYTLLTSVHPAQLDAALSSLAEALQGQGPNLGQLITRADQYLRTLAPELPSLDDIITSLATVSQEIAKNAPALLGSLANTLVVSKAVLAEKQAVASLLAAAPAAIDHAQALLRPSTVDDVVTILRNEVPVTAAFAADPNALPNTITGFKSFADTFGQTMSSGHIRANILLTSPNFAELFNALASGPGRVWDAVSDPPEYTAADCPRYAGMDGPNCGAAAGPDGANARMISTGSGYGGTSSSVGSQQEVFTVRSAASTITGLPMADIPAATDLLLGPLLRGTATVLR